MRTLRDGAAGAWWRALGLETLVRGACLQQCAVHRKVLLGQATALDQLHHLTENSLATALSLSRSRFFENTE